MRASVSLPGQQLLERKALPHKDPAPELLVVPCGQVDGGEVSFQGFSLHRFYEIALQTSVSSSLDISIKGIEGVRDHTACNPRHSWQLKLACEPLMIHSSVKSDIQKKEALINPLSTDP